MLVLNNSLQYGLCRRHLMALFCAFILQSLMKEAFEYTVRYCLINNNGFAHLKLGHSVIQLYCLS
jgi:hypothetical protein